VAALAAAAATQVAADSVAAAASTSAASAAFAASTAAAEAEALGNQVSLFTHTHSLARTLSIALARTHMLPFEVLFHSTFSIYLLYLHLLACYLLSLSQRHPVPLPSAPPSYFMTAQFLF